MKDNTEKKGLSRKSKITLGTGGFGAAGFASIGGVIGGVFGGPVGAVIGASAGGALGGVAGGMTGNAIAEFLEELEKKSQANGDEIKKLIRMLDKNQDVVNNTSNKLADGNEKLSRCNQVGVELKTEIMEDIAGVDAKKNEVIKAIDLTKEEFENKQKEYVALVDEMEKKWKQKFMIADERISNDGVLLKLYGKQCMKDREIFEKVDLLFGYTETMEKILSFVCEQSEEQQSLIREYSELNHKLNSMQYDAYALLRENDNQMSVLRNCHKDLVKNRGDREELESKVNETKLKIEANGREHEILTRNINKFGAKINKWRRKNNIVLENLCEVKNRKDIPDSFSLPLPEFCLVPKGKRAVNSSSHASHLLSRMMSN